MSAIKPLINQLTKMVKEGYDLSKRELPEIGKQILHYYLWVNILQSVMSLFTSLVFSKFTWILLEYINQSRDAEGLWLGVFFLGGISLVFFAFVYDGLSTILKIALAPKLFLLDTLAHYLNA